MKMLAWMWAQLALRWNEWHARRVSPYAPFEAHHRLATRMSRNRETIEATYGRTK